MTCENTGSSLIESILICAWSEEMLLPQGCSKHSRVLRNVGSQVPLLQFRAQVLVSQYCLWICCTYLVWGQPCVSLLFTALCPLLFSVLRKVPQNNWSKSTVVFFFFFLLFYSFYNFCNNIIVFMKIFACYLKINQYRKAQIIKSSSLLR